MTNFSCIPDDEKKSVASTETAGLLPAWVNPDLDRLMVVKEAEGEFRSWAESLVDLPAGALFARITGVTTVRQPSWSSVQVRIYITPLKKTPLITKDREYRLISNVWK